MYEPDQNDAASSYHFGGVTRDFLRKIRLWFQAVSSEPFYFYGEMGNLLFNVGKSILEGAVLYTMFSMAQSEFKVAAIMGVLTKYTYPAIVVVSNANISSFIDYLEKIRDKFHQVKKLIHGLIYVGAGEAVGAALLVLCFPPFFRHIFGNLTLGKYILISLYLFHHLFSGAAQVVEGRIWFRIIEIKIRNGNLENLASNFWSIHAMSLNINLIASMILLWGTTAVVGFFEDNLDNVVVLVIVFFGLGLALASKFVLPLAWKMKLRDEELLGP